MSDPRDVYEQAEELFYLTVVDDDEPEEPEVDDDFPMYLEYDGMWGASDFDNDRAAAEYEAYEREVWGD